MCQDEDCHIGGDNAVDRDSRLQQKVCGLYGPAQFTEADVVAAAAKEEEDKEAEKKAEDDIAVPEEEIKQEEETTQKKSCSQCQVK